MDDRAEAYPLRRVRAAVAVPSWALWRVPPRGLALVLAVDALAVAVVLLSLTMSRPLGRTDLVLAIVVAAGGVIHIEIARHVERLRFLGSVDRSPYIDLKSVWSFAAVLLLPLPAALGVVALTYVITWLRTAHAPQPHRWTYSCATVLLATAAACQVMSILHPASLVDGADGALAVGLAIGVRWTVNHGLVSAVIALTDRSRSFGRTLLAPLPALLGLGGLALGALLALLLRIDPWFSPLVLIPLMVVHRGLFMDQLVRSAHVDAKTGLATPQFWHAEASRVLDRLRRRGSAAGLLMIDLDEFKDVNDRWGHLAGDRVLRAVADMLADEFADALVARFGGEEFVVLLMGADDAAVERAAETARRRTTTLAVPVDGAAVSGLSMSIGTSTYPATGTTLDELIVLADTALYSAKRAGRNRVQASTERAPLSG